MSRMMSPPIVSDSWLGRGFLRPVLPLHSKEPVLEQPERERERDWERRRKGNEKQHTRGAAHFSPLSPFPSQIRKKFSSPKKKVSDNNQK